jgi:ATP-dependent protease ClpP protease subunit
VITTILISGLLTKARLDRAIEEIRHVAVGNSADENLVLIFNSPGGDCFAALRFLDAVHGDERTRRLAERAEVKIYDAHSTAAMVAFALGSKWELWVNAKIGFHLGETNVQVGNPDHFDQDGRLAAWIVEEWRRYRTAVTELMDRLGLNTDRKLQAEFWATGRLDLSARECLRRGLVSRLF